MIRGLNVDIAMSDYYFYIFPYEEVSEPECFYAKELAGECYYLEIYRSQVKKFDEIPYFEEKSETDYSDYNILKNADFYFVVAYKGEAIRVVDKAFPTIYEAKDFMYLFQKRLEEKRDMSFSKLCEIKDEQTTRV